MSSIGSGMSPSAKNGSRSMYTDRVLLSHITSNPSLGEEKVLNTEIQVLDQKCLIIELRTHYEIGFLLQPVFLSTRAYISFIKPDQTMWYQACKTCNKKVTEALDSGYWCEGCQKKYEECSLR